MNEYDAVWQILCDSFPEGERRSREKQEALLRDPRYTLRQIREKDTVIGFYAFWTMKGFRFVEHVALAPACRGKGHGARIFEALFAEGENVLLEVELPETDVASRRIGFYERLGFHLNRYPYRQPPYEPGQEPIPMYLMSWPEPLDPEGFRRVRAELYREVYGLNTDGSDME